MIDPTSLQTNTRIDNPSREGNHISGHLGPTILARIMEDRTVGDIHGVAPVLRREDHTAEIPRSKKAMSYLHSKLQKIAKTENFETDQLTPITHQGLAETTPVATMLDIHAPRYTTTHRHP